MARTLLDRLWDAHVVADLGDGWSLLHVDRHLLHDLSGTAGLDALAARGLPVRNPELAFATADHAVSSAPGRTGESYAPGAPLWAGLRARAAEAGLHYFELGQVGQGIVHVMGPELGITLPGVSLICGDSHTCTHGGLGALAFGVGSSELTHALATQTLRQKKPKNLRVRFEGAMGRGIAPKDLILHLIGRLGADAGTGYAIEYAGSAIRGLGIAGRMTVCNLSIELGAKIGFVAPDDTTFAYVEGRRFAPKGADFERAVAHWRSLASDADAAFDREVVIDVAAVTPTVTWGTSPEHAIAIDAAIPDPRAAPDAERREAWRAALDYMGLEPGRPLAGTPVDWVFIGSCTNSRIEDLREAAALARGRHVAPGVTAWVVPGSERVKRDAEAEGLDRVFREAGFAWREPGCSLCVAANGERVPPGARSVSTSNRNFVGRQGPGARTHLASPAMAVAAAVTGAITDARRI
ncbi:3-isopropylmalate dehydratase large subunit [Methylobacterium platani]|uniref:3-isopropylmalate dehydratase n=2 Tax=Methylobacterium platani TaxID=427683 RepID=A0A179SJY2_9HYPH|nr:3-isopropylmalate dehydratase large subunit [Methylobacterium platani]KMO19086.1 3-isopropylmalate dehydratase [Methylobacterium platani JCM 14648]OAS27330.1 3-isopropylmalate dehydratase [Methylobacterium platani]